MRTLTAMAAGASVVAVGLLVATVPASAEPDPPDCPKGNVCVFSVDDVQGPAVIKTTGNWSGSYTVGPSGSVVFNNGAPQPGLDHVQATWISDGKTFGRCLHNNPGPGDYRVTLTRDLILTSLVWRGECAD
ncbi:hypothetical protein [Sciscionella sediminilitoris]|uniref:hypothetical protein n=1 Tax=Sciscionella sediminilitoris TaxID=1445613 RepID=UPI0004DF248F|nr:hypothetical protein [Sciscionella sp. SE31]